MPIIKCCHKTNPFVIYDKTFIRDNRLTPAAMGVLCYLLQLPADWDIKPKEIATHFACGVKTIYTAFRELQRLGYLEYQHQRCASGTFSQVEYTAYELPQPHLAQQQSTQQTPQGPSDDTVQQPHHHIDDTATQFQAQQKQTVPQPTQNGGSITASPQTPHRHAVTHRTAETPHAAKGSVLNNNANKIISIAAVMKNNNNGATEKLQPPPIAAASFSICDGIIANRLTPHQKQRVIQAAHQLSSQTDIEAKQLENEITNTLLNPNCYTAAGQDFMKKLNTIKKCIRNGTWTASVRPDPKHEAQPEPIACPLTKQFHTLMQERQHWLKMVKASSLSSHKATGQTFKHLLTGVETKLQAIQKQLETQKTTKQRVTHHA